MRYCRDYPGILPFCWESGMLLNETYVLVSAIEYIQQLLKNWGLFLERFLQQASSANSGSLQWTIERHRERFSPPLALVFKVVLILAQPRHVCAGRFSSWLWKRAEWKTSHSESHNFRCQSLIFMSYLLYLIACTEWSIPLCKCPLSIINHRHFW